MTGKPVSKQTQKNWWIDASLALTAVIAALSGIYFLYLPSGGYMGGRNSLYNVTVLFSRHTWDQIHLWGGLAMILAATVHLAIHWTYVVNMTRRTWKETLSTTGRQPSRHHRNHEAFRRHAHAHLQRRRLDGLGVARVPRGSRQDPRKRPQTRRTQGGTGSPGPLNGQPHHHPPEGRRRKNARRTRARRSRSPSRGTHLR